MTTITPATRRLAASLLSQLKEPATPAALCNLLGISRATVHRGLALLMAENIIVKVANGPKAAYRAATPQEVTAAQDKPRDSGLSVTLEMAQADAQALQECLELYSRLGIGQFGEIESWLRFGTIRHGDGKLFELDELDPLSATLQQMKWLMTGMDANTSNGIHSNSIAPATRTAWGITKAIRHRMAWDRSPQGGMGVSFDEPMHGLDETAGELAVYSFEKGHGPRIGLCMPSKLLAPVVNALKVAEMTFQGRVWGCAELFMTAEAHTKALEQAVLLQALDKRLQGLWGLPQNGETLLSGDLLASLQRLQQALSAAEQGVLANRSYTATFFGHDPVHAIELACGVSLATAVGVKDLPANYFLGYKGGQYQVMRADPKDDAIVIVGQSYSLQTAVLKARNMAGGGQGRATTF